tara:strand:+ start:1132 stop:1590 length:459 start_codon:yes stop_codon:yes gene_type:complete
MALCEMCGKESNLISAEVDGADLKVCSGCAKFGKVKKNFHSRPAQFKNKFNRQKGPEYKIVNNFSSLLSSARNKKGMDREEFSKFLNEKESVVAKWEQGSLKPRVNTARRLGKILDLKLTEKDVDAKDVELKKSKSSDSFTLGDFIKVRKRK